MSVASSPLLLSSESYSVVMKKIWEATESHARQWRTVFKVRGVPAGDVAMRHVQCDNLTHTGVGVRS